MLGYDPTQSLVEFTIDWVNSRKEGSMHQFHMIEDYVAGHYATTCIYMNPVDAARQVFKFRNEYRRLLEEELKKKRKKADEEKKYLNFSKAIGDIEKDMYDTSYNTMVHVIDQYVNKRKNRTNVLSVPCPKCSSGIGEPCRYISGAATSKPHVARMRHHAALWGKKG
jgi:hypothetical protein